MASEKDTIDNITDLIAVVREFLAADRAAFLCLEKRLQMRNIPLAEAERWQAEQHQLSQRCNDWKAKMREIMTNL